MNSRYPMKSMYGAMMTFFRLLRSSPKCMNTKTMYAAFTNVRMMNDHLIMVHVNVSERLKFLNVTREKYDDRMDEVSAARPGALCY